MTAGDPGAGDDPFYVAVCNAQEIFLFVNTPYAARFGLLPPQIVGRSVRDVLGPSAHATVAPYIHRVLAGEEVEFTREMTSGALGTRLMHVTYLPQANEAGGVDRFIAVLQDASARGDAERARQDGLAAARAAQQLAETANRMKDEFLATISHELRTPINAVLGWTRMLKQPGLDAEARARGIDSVERNAKATATIIEDLLDVSRAVTGDLRIGRNDVDVDELLRRAIETVGPAALVKHQRVSLSILDRAPHVVVGDAMRLQQVVWNVLSNAIRYTPDAGRIAVTVHARDEEVLVQISDSGEGIAAEALPFIFDRFRQADSSTTRRHGGLGLGLAIARQLVFLHGGSISGHSEGKGAGAVFVITLPRKAETQPEQLTLRATEAQAILDRAHLNVAGIAVLLVDSDDESREFIGTTLRREGVDVTSVRTGAAARDACTGGRFDVLLCATALEDGDGYSLLRTLRAGGRCLPPSTPAVALTAYRRVEDRTRAHAAGFQLHLGVPVHPSELIAAIWALRPRSG
ncbi:MAG: two-component hybrid sensor and regulator [Acidobacteria bacterium]|nr:two-component hybrid sensor and regulator [Acidobacteriota bacterium]